MPWRPRRGDSARSGRGAVSARLCAAAPVPRRLVPRSFPCDPYDSIGRSRSDLESGPRLRAPTTGRELLQRRPHADQRLGVELRDARLGHAEHLADLLHGQLVPVVQREDELLPFRQATDGGGHQPSPLVGKEDGQGLVRFRLSPPVARQVECHVVEADQGDRGDLVQQGVVLREGEPERGRELALAGRTPETPLRIARRPPHRGRLLAHAARSPVVLSQLIEDGAANTKSCVGGESRVTRGLVAFDGGQEPEGSPGDEVVELDASG